MVCVCYYASSKRDTVVNLSCVLLRHAVQRGGRVFIAFEGTMDE